ncbi:Uncharacterised protein [Legionella busanensis]|uniref:Uncharacterized protein n=1 Tax=Legionella busanensis TaxID=190655 RepID=A0A378KBH1_9GAMM|nr:hypothetical protein [Legionella busanensis]STX81690.1 Uncharacterised protein [Legionella busanensis]
MNTYYVYRVNFQPEPIIQGKIEKFDEEEEAKQYINKNKSSYQGSKWLIIRQVSSSESYELQELI